MMIFSTNTIIDGVRDLKMCCSVKEHLLPALNLTSISAVVSFVCVTLFPKYLNRLMFSKTIFLTRKAQPCLCFSFIVIAYAVFIFPSVYFHPHRLCFFLQFHKRGPECFNCCSEQYYIICICYVFYIIIYKVPSRLYKVALYISLIQYCQMQWTWGLLVLASVLFLHFAMYFLQPLLYSMPYKG